jgi:hypothetical protein
VTNPNPNPPQPDVTAVPPQDRRLPPDQPGGPRTLDHTRSLTLVVSWLTTPATTGATTGGRAGQ